MHCFVGIVPLVKCSLRVVPYQLPLELFHANFPFFLPFFPSSVVFCCAFLFSLPFAFPVAFSLSCQCLVLFPFPSAFPRQLFLSFAFLADVSIAFPYVLVFPCIWFVRSLLLSLVPFILLSLLLSNYVPISVSFCILFYLPLLLPRTLCE